jgi:hypothetical protein
MQPREWVSVLEIPLTSSGKVDKAALLGLRSRLAHEGAEVEAPRTPLEATVLRIWADVLRRSRLGVTSNFFESGGDSLSALRAIVRMSDAFGSDFNLRDLYTHPTVASFCASCVDVAPDRDSLLLSFGNGSGTRPAVVFLPPAFGSAAMFAPLAQRLAASADVYGVEYLEPHELGDVPGL